MTGKQRVRVPDLVSGLVRALPRAHIAVRGLWRLAMIRPDQRKSIGALVEKWAAKLPSHTAVADASGVWAVADRGVIDGGNGMSEVRLHFEHMPSPLLGFLRAAVAGGNGIGDGRSIPRLEAEVAGVQPEVGHIRRYAELCGYPQSRWLPLTYPHVLAAPLHPSVLTHRAFPLRLLGLVHVRNAVQQLRPLERGESLHIEVRVEGHHDGSPWTSRSASRSTCPGGCGC